MKGAFLSFPVVILNPGSQQTGAINVSGTITGASFVGNASSASILATPRAINGVNFDGSAPITVTAAAGTLTGATLASGVLASSLTSVGVLASPHFTSPVVDSGSLTLIQGSIPQVLIGDRGVLQQVSSGGDVHFTGNSYYNGSNYIAVVTGVASRIIHSSGSIYFQTAPSVSAGATQTFTTQLLIQSTSPTLTVTNSLQVTAGNVGIGPTTLNNVHLYLSGSTTIGGSQYGLISVPTFSSAATSTGFAGEFQVATAAAAFTLADARAIHISTPSVGSGSAITTAYGLQIDAQTAGGTNNYGIYVNAPSGGSGNNIGIYNLGATKLTPGAFAASDKYLVVDSSGNVHVSALGPAS